MSDEEESISSCEEEEEEIVQQIEEENIDPVSEDDDDKPDEILVDDSVESEGVPIAGSTYSFVVRICLPLEMMPGIEAKRYIDAMIRKSGGRVESVVRCARIPSADYEIMMKEHIVNVQIPVSSESTVQIALAAFLSRFSTESRGGLQNQLMIEIPKLSTVFNEIRTEDNQIGLGNFALGNCPNPGLFFVRGNYFTKVNSMPSNTKLSTGNLDKNARIEKPFGTLNLLSYVHFEHDQKHISIKFAIPMSKPDEDGLAFRGFKMNLQYSAIQSITVDSGQKNLNRKSRSIDFSFRLNHPPSLYEVQPTTMADQKRIINLQKTIRTYNTWSRVLQWPGHDRSHGCSKECLSDSSVLHLSIHLNNEKDRVRMFSIAARIQSRVPTIKVYFGSIVSMRRRVAKIRSLPPLGSYRADYALKAIISRGTVVTDELFDAAKENNTVPFFIRRLLWCMKECQAACEEALELVLTAIDERRNITIERAFDRLYTTRVELYRRSASSHRSVQAVRTIPPNCVLVRKLMVTPSRLLPMSPDVMMTNRVVRQFGAENALRIVYRDENGQKLKVNDFGQDQMAPLLIDMVKNTMDKKVTICGRDYQFLAWSNSQMRDHGCYMYSQVEKEDGTIITIDKIRDWMGNFSSSKNVPKLMSRMGQCFTQAQPTVSLNMGEWRIDPDIVGGSGHAETKELYTFSDGVGRMSMSLARELAEMLELKIVPSCYQVRFRGFKGVLTIDRTLDAPGEPRVIFRNSQNKFIGSAEDDSSILEVVKYAMPSPMCLNRPLITILDFVSENQGKDYHENMCSRIHYYLEKELNTLSQMLLSDKEAATALTSRVPLSMDFHRLLSAGFTFTNEPFFHEMLVAIYRYSVSQHLAKAKLEMPSEMGRSMFGVLDETGLLQYGQVFIQYSPSVRNASDKPIVHLGPILVSKNPCHAPGDARVFEAVWQPALSHLSDVIVFPRYGERPHADEMAGSDLDGDEYSVIFDPKMLLGYNEEAMVFPKQTAANYNFTPTTSDIADFFLKYLQSDSVGLASNAHLHMADKRGLFTSVCESLARKCSIAVDFPKTGEPADALEQNERLDALPDFAGNRKKQSYRSTRLNGRLYRRVKKIEEVMELCERSKSIFSGNYDQILYRPLNQSSNEWREARGLRDDYTAEMQQLMDEYGINSEAAIVSGKLINPKRLAAMEKDDYSFYNTDKMVELRYQKMWSKYRRIFFEEFGDEEELMETDHEGKEVIRTDSTMREKARLWYILAYIDDESTEDEVKVSTKPCKSFAWIVWDVLADLKRRELMNLRGVGPMVEATPPVAKILTEEIRKFLNEKSIEFSDFCIAAKREDEVIERYASTYGKGLYEMLFILDRWLKKDSLYDRTPLRLTHLARLFIHFCLGEVYTHGSIVLPLEMITPFPLKLKYSADPTVSQGDYSTSISEPGHIILLFLSYIASYAFLSVPSINLSFDDGSPYPSPFLHRPSFWKPLSHMAFKTIHHISLSGRFSSLTINEEDGNDLWAESVDPLVVSADFFKEEGFRMGDGNSYHNGRRFDQIMIDTLKKWSGVTTILKREGTNKNRDAIVTMAGTASGRMRLTRLFQMDPMQLKTAVKLDQPPSVLWDESL
ncbi:rrf-3 [Pristionchus pacificus]|uniref:RNA-directed RNA polymerase n=1 Tax=Pristionchus pacificus TaxID=54126 RepID=A0A8R1V6A4_PRIPA|nr:rrf-3 [Pristionchus pacificus]